MRNGLSTSARLQSRRAMRHGFTLVELCVVIGILGLLAAIIVPAVQAVRETSRRTTCANNLRQIAIAFQSHAETYGIFPGVGFERQGWLTRIAPFLELPKPVIAENGMVISGSWEYSILKCPSDWGSVEGPGSNFLVNNGQGRLANNGMHSVRGHESIRNVRPEDVTDGLSNTAQLGEILVALAHTPELSFRPADDPIWWHRRYRKTSIYLSDYDAFADECEQRSKPIFDVHISTTTGYTHIQTPNRHSCLNGNLNDQRSTDLYAYTLTSLHSGGVNVARCDASLRFESDAIDRRVWRDLGSRCPPQN